MIGVEELVDEVFEGSCILKIYRAYVRSCKSISLSVEAILARRIGIGESYFADESDESDESDEEHIYFRNGVYPTKQKTSAQRLIKRLNIPWDTWSQLCSPVREGDGGGWGGDTS